MKIGSRLRRHLSPLAGDSVSTLDLPPVRMGLLTKLNLLTVGLIFLTAVALSVMHFAQQWREDKQELRSQGNTMLGVIAQLAEHGIDTSDRPFLEQMLDSVGNNPDAAYASVFDGRREVISERRFGVGLSKENLPPLDPLPAPSATGRAVERDVVIGDRRYIEFIVPVMKPRSAAGDAASSGAQGAGADAFFDEKYGERVRTIRVEGFSHELCGGTHCRASGQVGNFVITSERSIGSGVRRIEAVTGAAADRLMDERFALLERAVAAVGARGTEALEERIAALQDELREAKRRLRAGVAAGGRPKPGDIAAGAEEIAPGVAFVGVSLDLESIDALKGFAKDVRSVLASGVIALGLDADEPQLFVTVSEDLVARGISAGALVQAAVAPMDGRGGGRPEMAQGKGTNRVGLADAIAAVRAAVAERGAGG